MKIKKKLQQLAISFDDCTTLKENYHGYTECNDGNEKKRNGSPKDTEVAWDVDNETDYPENVTAWKEAKVTGRDKSSEWMVKPASVN